MGIVILIIGAVIIAAAIRDTHEKLFGALAEDMPAFMVWGAAVFAVGAIGWVPGMNPVSRGLLALIVVVLVLTNYRAIIEGFSQPLASESELPSGSAGQGSSGSGGGGGGGGGISFNPGELLPHVPELPDYMVIHG